MLLHTVSEPLGLAVPGTVETPGRMALLGQAMDQKLVSANQILQ